MWRSALFAVGVVSSAAAAPLIAQSDTEATPEQSAESTSDEMVCRRFPITGSYTRTRRVCMTESQWNDSARRGQDETRRWMGNSAISSGSENPNPPAGTCCD